MSPRSFRSMIAMPLLVLAMVAIPALLLSFTSGGNVQAQAGCTVAPCSPITIPPTATRPIPMATKTPVIVPLFPINGCTYVVLPNDTLSTIAVRARTTVYALMQLNGIRNPNHLVVGQHLQISDCAVEVAAAAAVPMTEMPTETATPMPNAASAKGYGLKKVIGNWLSSTIYGYSDNNWLFRTPDNGETWMLISTKPAVEDFVMSPAEPNVLYSGTGQGCSISDADTAPMYKSVNGGMTFVNLANARNLRPLLAHGIDKNILFAADCTSPYLTTDGGFSWIEKLGGSDSIWTVHHAQEMVAGQFVGDPQPEQPNWDHVYAIGTDKDGNSIIAYTTDSGNTWQNLTPKTEASLLHASAVDADPQTAGKIWSTDSQGVWVKAGIDESWTITFAGLQDLLVDSEAGPQLKLNDVVAHPNGSLYLATIHGLYTFSPDAAEWTKIVNGSFDSIEIYNILFTKSNPNVLWLNTANGVFTYNVAG